MSNFSLPSQFEISSITIDGEDVIGIFFSISLHEDIYRPILVGDIVLADTDAATEQGSYIEKENIEFIEPISFSFTNALGDTLDFDGVLNGLTNEYVKNGIKYYTVGFTSESMRENEKQFVVKAFKESKPEDIVSEMVELLGEQLDTQAKGQQMNYIGGRKRPIDVIGYVCTHGLTQNTEATENEESKEEEAKGTTGFLCWQTLDGYKFEPVDSVLSGKSGQEHKDFKTQLVNQSLSVEELMKSVVQSDFPQIGDYQTKLRSGAFGSKLVSYDMDTGLYKEYKYYNDKNMTDKQKEAFPEGSISRWYNRMIDNQKFSNECEKAQPNTGDQSRKYLEQNAGRQNTFTDQTGNFTLYPQFNFRAGDTFDCTINSIADGDKQRGEPNKKHSGKYVIQAIHHYLCADGAGYTRIKTIRSTIQQDETSSSQV